MLHYLSAHLRLWPCQHHKPQSGARQASAKWAVKAWRVFCHWSTTGKRLTVSTEQCSGSGGGRGGSATWQQGAQPVPAQLSGRRLVQGCSLNVRATTDLSVQQPGTQGHKGVNAACRVVCWQSFTHHELSSQTFAEVIKLSRPSEGNTDRIVWWLN